MPCFGLRRLPFAISSEPARGQGPREEIEPYNREAGPERSARAPLAHGRWPNILGSAWNEGKGNSISSMQLRRSIRTSFARCNHRHRFLETNRLKDM